MADNIRRPARARMWKRVAIIGASVSTVALTAFVILSFLPHGNDAFSIRINDMTKEQAEQNHFHMSRGWNEKDQKDVDEVPERRVRGKSVDKMTQTTASVVEDFIAEKRAANLLYDQTNFYTQVKNEETGELVDDKGKALVYTVYLVNEDATKDLKLKYALNVESYYNSNTISLLDYFRVLAQTELMGSDEIVNTYYGRQHTFDDRKNDLPSEGDRDKEPISTKILNEDDTYSAVFKSSGNNGYCERFDELSEENKTILHNDSLIVPAGKTLRFTFAAYFEGNDPDSVGSNPSNSYLQLSLHFGV